MKLIRSIEAASLMISNIRTFYPSRLFEGKKVAIIGAADTAFEEKNGDFIESFDLIVRINKAIHTWDPEDEAYIGKRTDILFHSFFENEYSGGGPIDFDLFREFGVKYVVHPNRDLKGTLAHLNFYKRHLKPEETYLLDAQTYKRIKERIKPWTPTVGLSALASVLNSSCKELYITGFTFFKTPYAKGYRDQFLDTEANTMHIKNQGLHNPDQELRSFLEFYRNSKCLEVRCDQALDTIIKQFSG